MRHAAVLVALVLALVALAACAQNASSSSCSDGTSAIVNDTTASAYPEAMLIDIYQSGQLYAACSGSIVAPQVVLTAGHCVDGFSQWKVTAPFSGKQTASSTSGETYDWHENGSETVNPNHHDI